MDNKPSKSKFLLLVTLDLILIILAVYLYYSIKPYSLTRRILGPLKNIYNRYWGKFLCPDCNIILVSIDTFSANHLPCYGYTRNTAVDLCRFGQDNILFENAYSNAHYTLPSHTSIFTGLLPSAHKVSMPNLDKLDTNIPFLPQILKNNGYEAYFNMIKKDAHLPIDRVFNRGIDQIIAPNYPKNFWEKGFQKLKENNEKNKKTFLFLHTYAVHSPYLIGDEKPLFTDKTFDTIPTNNTKFKTCSEDFVTFVKSSLALNLKDEYWKEKTPFYQVLYRELLNTTDTKEFCKKYDDVLDHYRSDYYYNKNNIDTTEKVEYIKALYDQKIVELDGLLKPLLDLIKQDDIKQNTILIITSDHGEEFMEHGQIQHSTLFDSNIRIPLIMYVPGTKNKKIAKISQSIDIVPTLLDLVGVKHNYIFQGRSLVEDLKGEKKSKEYAVAEKIGEGLKTIRDERYKLFVKQTGSQLEPYQLFDLQKDPGELQNIIFSHEEVVNNLRRTLSEIINF